MTKTSSLALGLCGLLLLTTACSGQSTDAPAGSRPAAAAASPGMSKVLLLGDSVAAGEAPPLGAAFAAADVPFQSLAADGGGNVVGPFSDEQWKTLPKEITAAKPSLVVYQITTYDWGSRDEQESAYRRLLSTVTRAGAELVFVTMPPIKPDDFYKPHKSDLDRAPAAARTVAEGSSGKAHLLDAGEVWGDSYQQHRNGKADRSSDGVHTCPQGAARFTKWLLDALAKRFPGFTPPDPQAWANTGWSADKRFKGC
ncbi:SGNH/GDSL hydrolase family protein [Actinoplanes sp. NPDC049548]|uniref:SGNH/GDSL hydrolase family protein n=1 Tax=Actinoplanes sp. NPDC049548 TaxID=3155152 RepID=UPI00341F26CD